MTDFQILRRALACTALITLTTPAFAAESDAAAAVDADADQIIVRANADPLALTKKTEGGSRLMLTPLETPASVEVLDGDAIRLRGDQTVQAAAARATGIVNTSGVFGYGLSARGFTGNTSVMQLYDGMRMYNNTLTFPAESWMADRVEVLRGPASVLYGEGAIGGAINVVRKQPSDTPNSQVQASYGRFDTFVLAGGSGGPITDKIGYRVDATYRQSDGWMQRGRSKSFALSGALRFAPTEDLTITLSHDHSLQRPRTWFGVPLVNGKLDRSIARRNYNVNDAELRFRDDWTQAKVEWTPSEDIAVQSVFYRLTANKYWHNAENLTYVAAQGTTPASIRQSSFYELYQIQKQIGNRTTARFDHSLAGMENHVVVGFDYNRIRYASVNNSGNTATQNVSLSGRDISYFQDQTGVRATLPRYTNRIRQFSIFAEDRLVIGPQFSVVAGVRYDRPRIRKTDYINAANNFVAVPDAVTWRAGVVYNPIETLSLYASYATAADPVGALVSTSVAQSAFDLSTGRQWEAGIKHVFWGGKGQWTLAAYDIVKRKLLTSDPLTPSIQIQVGQQSSKGIEASFSLEPASGLTVTLNGSVLKARYDDFSETVAGIPVQRAGNRPTNVAQKSANAFASWEFLNGWVVDGGVSYVGDRYQDTANTRRIPAYTVTDVGLRWQFIANATIDVRLNNLFNKTYVRSTYGSTQWVLGDPRTFMVTLNGAF